MGRVSDTQGAARRPPARTTHPPLLPLHRYQQCHNSAKPFELFGFDILLDEALKPWLIEVNVACSLASSSPLDKRIKDMLVTDML